MYISWLNVVISVIVDWRMTSEHTFFWYRYAHDFFGRRLQITLREQHYSTGILYTPVQFFFQRKESFRECSDKMVCLIFICVTIFYTFGNGLSIFCRCSSFYFPCITRIKVGLYRFSWHFLCYIHVGLILKVAATPSMIFVRNNSSPFCYFLHLWNNYTHFIQACDIEYW